MHKCYKCMALYLEKDLKFASGNGIGRAAACEVTPGMDGVAHNTAN